MKNYIYHYFNTLRPEQDDQHFQMQFLEWNILFFITITLQFIVMGPITNNSALAQVMASCWTGQKPLPEPMMTQFTDASMHHRLQRVNYDC